VTRYTPPSSTGSPASRPYIVDGKLHKVVLIDKGLGLDASTRKDFEEFVKAYALDIVEKWVDYFVRKKPVHAQVITKKVKNARTGN
jgi:hypothetical protein